MKRSHSVFLLVLAAGLLAGAGGCTHSTAAVTAAGDPAKESAAEAASSEGAVDRVTAAPPQRKTLELFTTQPGRIEAFEETPLYPKLAGYVDEVLVDIGDAVKKGDPLVKLWIPELRDEVEQKSALVAQAEAELRQAEAAIKSSQAAVESAAARVTQANAGVTRAAGEYERWKAEHTRVEQLAAGGSVTRKLVDEALNQFAAAKAAQQEAAASVESAQAALKEVQVNVDKAVADQGAAEARLRVAQADLARAETMLAYTEITAPFDGVVTARNVDTRHYVQPASGGAKPLLVVVRNDQVRIFVDVPESEAALVDGGENGDQAVIYVQALGGRELEARVTRTSWSLDAMNRSLRVEIDVPNPDGVLRPGMYATATVLLEKREETLVLPTTAILRDGRDSFCCCVESGKIAHRPVQLGLRSGADVEILSGVGPQDTVVLTGADALEPGQPVEVRQPEA